MILLIIFSRHNKYKRYGRSLVTLTDEMNRATRRSSHEEDNYIEKIIKIIFFLLFFIPFKVNLSNRLEINLHVCLNIEMEVWMLVQWAKIEKICTSYMLIELGASRTTYSNLLVLHGTHRCFTHSLKHILQTTSIDEWHIEPLMPLIRHR